MKSGEEKSGNGKSRSIRYLIIFTICLITYFVVALAWCTRAQARDGNEGFVQGTNALDELVNHPNHNNLNMKDGPVSKFA